MRQHHTSLQLLTFACLALLTLAAVGCGKSTVSRPGPAPSKAPAQKPAQKPQKPYSIGGETYRPLASAHGFVEEGLASWYGKDFHGRKTANGEVYDMYGMTAAHKILPFNTDVLVTNLENGKSVTVRVNDRGPFIRGRVIDLTHTAAAAIDMIGPGVARVRVEAVGEVAGMTEAGELMGSFYVQVGSFTQRANAERLAAELRARGYDGTRVAEAVVGGQRFHRVQAGRYRELGRAEAARAGLAGQYPAAFVIAD